MFAIVGTCYDVPHKSAFQLKRKQNRPKPGSPASTGVMPGTSSAPTKIATQKAESGSSALTTRLTAVPPLVWLLTVTLAGLLLFIDRPFFIDDLLFLRSAEQIQKHPTDFYGFTINWVHTPQPMYEVFENPPLACYYVALVSSILGWSEPALHLGFLFPALAAVWGIFCFARFHCNQPAMAAAIAVFTPVFFISATTIMCDVLLLGFWVWSLVLFERGLRTQRPSWFVASGCLAGLAYLTKFPGLALVPLLVAYGLLNLPKSAQSEPTRDLRVRASSLAWVIAPLLPLLFAAGYEWLTHHLYGKAHLLQAAGYAHEQNVSLSVWKRLLLGAGFAGGCFLPVLFWLRWSRRLILGSLCLLLVSFLLLPKLSVFAPFLRPNGHLDWLLSLESGLFLLAGAHLFRLAIDNWPRSGSRLLDESPRGCDGLLLLFWVFGVFIFATVFNWVVNGRSFLPMAPAVGILVARSWPPGSSTSDLKRLILLAGLPSLILSLVLARSDRNEAAAQRAAATDLCAKYQIPGRTVWFEGHWGFQYYMEKLGAKALDMAHPQVKPGDIIVIPNSAPSVSRPDMKIVSLIDSAKYRGNLFISTMNPSIGAGFYAAYRGPLPFAAGRIKPDYYLVFTPKASAE